MECVRCGVPPAATLTSSPLSRPNFFSPVPLLTLRSDLTTAELFSRLQSSQSAAHVSPPHIDSPGQLDILVRTSDVKRLSDFMMWQCSADTQIHFVKTYWPDFGFTDMLPILLGWQQKMWARKLGW